MKALQLSDASSLLTKEVIEKAFKNKTKTNETVTSIEVSRASPAGEGLIGAVYRIHVKGTTKSTSFVAKSLVGDEVLRRTLQCERYFKREILFFTEILPAFIKCQKISGAKENIQNNIPICYASLCDGQNDFLLMEDLTTSECHTLTENPKLEERDKTLKALAHFHAVSMVLRVNHPDIFKKNTYKLPEIYYREDQREWYSKYLERAIEIDRDTLRLYECPKKSAYYKRFVDATSIDVYGELIRLSTLQSEHRSICHGDAWCPNFLCSEDRAVMIDFQLLRCASPATDLAYFIFICSNLCCSKEDFENAVKVYYEALAYYLNDMGVSPNIIFSAQHLESELKLFGRFGFLAALTSVPLRAGKDRCDVMQSFSSKYSGVDRIPLEELWPLGPIHDEEQRLKLVNIVRVAVDMGFI